MTTLCTTTSDLITDEPKWSHVVIPESNNLVRMVAEKFLKEDNAREFMVKYLTKWQECDFAVVPISATLTELRHDTVTPTLDKLKRTQFMDIIRKAEPHARLIECLSKFNDDGWDIKQHRDFLNTRKNQCWGKYAFHHNLSVVESEGDKFEHFKLLLVSIENHDGIRIAVAAHVEFKACTLDRHFMFTTDI